MSSLTKAISILVPMLMAAPVLAEQGSASELYQQGVDFLRSNQFPQALKSFNKAEEAGSESSSLYYNRGVALYRLKQYPEAKQSFLLALNGSGTTALVYYNLGLVSMRMGDAAAAMMAFSNAALSTTNKKIARLSNGMIAHLSDDIQKEAAASKRPSFTLRADGMLGYDDNVTLENTELAQSSPLKDMYYDLYASAKYQLAGDRKDGYWLQASASTLQYLDYSHYNYTQYSASLFKDKKYGETETRMGVKYARSYVGGNDYMDKFTARVQASYALSKQQKLRARYELATYDELDAKYSYLAGTRSRIRMDSTWRFKDMRARLGYEFEFNDRNDYALGNNYTSYSATRHKMYGNLTLKIDKSWKAKLGVNYRQSRFNDAKVVAGVTGVTRKDNRFRLSATGEYSVNRDVDLVVEYRYSDNDSNVAIRQYKRNQFLLGVKSYF